MSEKESGLGSWWYIGNQLVELANLREGSRVLDVGFGGGTSLFPAAQKVGPQGRVIGIDIDKRDVAAAETRIKEQGITNASVLEMDAWQMSFDDASFDNVLGGSVISFLFEKDTQKLCPEISRVLKVGGRAGFSTWKDREDFDWMQESLMRVFPEVPENELSVYSRHTPELLAEILSKAGFQDITKHTVTAEFIYEDKETWWKKMQLYTWKPFYSELAARDPEELEEFKETTYERLQARSKAEGISFKISTYFIFGTK
jgi:O-methyltransferase/aklanonic acid methyltransferase